MKQSWIITFAVNSILANYYVVIDNATNLQVRQWAAEYTKGMWCGCYPYQQLGEIQKSYPVGMFELQIPRTLRFVESEE